MSLSDAIVHLFLSQPHPLLLVLTVYLKLKERRETFWSCLMDNLKKTQRARSGLRRRLLASEKQVVQRDLFSSRSPLNSTVSALRPLMYSKCSRKLFMWLLTLVCCWETLHLMMLRAKRTSYTSNICGFLSPGVAIKEASTLIWTTTEIWIEPQ